MLRRKMAAVGSPTIRLLAGLVITLSAVAVYSGYTIHQLHSLRELQAGTIDRNRKDSLLLLRIQNTLNSLSIATRDMLDSNEPYPLTAWRPEFERLRIDLTDALAKAQMDSPTADNQRHYLANSLSQFWVALNHTFDLAEHGYEDEARAEIQLSLQAREAALTSAVARLLVRNNEAEEQAAQRTAEIYSVVERNVYIFQAAMLVLILLTSLYLVQYNRRMFDRVAKLSQRRGELSRQLITMQENAFRSISRDLHDDFGQILTAIGAMLRRPDKATLEEIRAIVQTTLEKVRTLSHALHPVALDEVGLESAVETYLANFQRQNGIEVRYEKSGTPRTIDSDSAAHLYRVLQEALNNVARHSGSKRATVRLQFRPQTVMLEVEDYGTGFRGSDQEGRRGLGLVSMRERAELMAGHIEFLDTPAGGALVRVTIPAAPITVSEEAHV
jgi:signal transduction histidine kinase